jgi:hypothetical protein
VEATTTTITTTTTTIAITTIITTTTIITNTNTTTIKECSLYKQNASFSRKLSQYAQDDKRTSHYSSI